MTLGLVLLTASWVAPAVHSKLAALGHCVQLSRCFSVTPWSLGAEPGMEQACPQEAFS